MFYLFFLNDLSDHNIWHRASCICGKFSSRSTFLYSMNILTIVILWVKAWYPLFACIIFKLEQSITDRNPEVGISKKNLFGQHDQTTENFCFILYFDFESDLSQKLHKKWSFSLRISSVLLRRNPRQNFLMENRISNSKTSFFVQWHRYTQSPITYKYS